MHRILKSKDQMNSIVSSYDYSLRFDNENSVSIKHNTDKDKNNFLQNDFSKNDDEIFEDADITVDADELKKEAEELLERAKKEAEEIKEKAKQDGYEEGYDDGYNFGKNKAFEEHKAEFDKSVSDFLNEIKNVSDELNDKKDTAFIKYQNDLKDLVIAVAEKVIHVSLRSSGRVIEKMIFSATENIRNKEWAKIYLSKSDADLILEGDANLLESLSHVSGHVRVMIMDNDNVGTCIIELPDEIIDASATTQLENIKDILGRTSM